jgi:hypothetical protein
MVRALTEEEMCATIPTAAASGSRLTAPSHHRHRKIFFDKLAKYIGHGIKALIDRPDGRYCFRLHRDRVFYVSEAQVHDFFTVRTRTRHCHDSCRR